MSKSYLINCIPTKQKLLDVMETLDFSDDNLDRMDECIDELLASIPTEEEKYKTVQRVQKQAQNLSQRLLKKYVEHVSAEKDLLEKEKESYKKELQQQMINKPKKMVFSTSDVLEITRNYKVKGKTTMNTIQSHIKKGILKATMSESNGLYSITRKDLEDYLGFNDF